MGRTSLRRFGAAAACVALAGIGVAAPLAEAHGGKKHQVARPVPLQILSFNDYHGHLDPPTGNDGRLTQADGTTVDAGGAAYLATHLASLRAGHRNTLTVAAGDLIGGSPFLSGLFRDEPSVETLNAMGLDVSSVGNHEFDDGVPELLRMQNGGCHPTDGCFDADGYSGADFSWLAANVVYKRGNTAGKRPGSTVLPGAWVTRFRGIKIGFIGMTLEGTPELVAQAGISDVTFKDEVETANRTARKLRRWGVKAIVVLLHEGGLPPAGSAFDYDCNAGGAAALSGPIVEIAENLSPSIDLVVTGHTHQPYICDIPDPAGHSRFVTSAASYGRIVTETNLLLSRRTHDVIRRSVRTVNHAVTRDVGLDAAIVSIIDKWKALSAPIANRPVGSITGDITRSITRDAESSLADLIADAQLDATDEAAAGGAQMAFMNPGGVRADLTFAGSTAGEGDGVVTYGEAFTVQPFGNLLVSMDLTGAQIETMLEQQWTTQSDGSVRFLHMGVSAGVRYSWSASGPVGDRIDPATITLNGTPLDPAATYRVTVNSFLADGGDGFLVLKEGANRVGGGNDLDAFNAYLTAHAPVTGPTPDRVTRLP